MIAILNSLLLESPAITGMASTMGLLLAGVFAVAGGIKLLDPTKTVAEFRQLRLPAPAILARAVPMAELATAFAIVVRPRFGALPATIMLLGFTAVVAATLRSGRTVSCGCLGALSRQPISGATMARNLVLMAMAAMTATVPSLGVPDAASLMATFSLLFMAVLATQLFMLRRTIGRLWSVELAGEQTTGRGARSTLNGNDVKGMVV